MIDTVAPVRLPEDARAAFDLLRAGIDAVRSLELSRLSDDEVLVALREWEVLKRVSVTAEHALIAQVDASPIAYDKGVQEHRNTAGATAAHQPR
ncbi:MAG TPA: hypothetical protein VKQ07_09595 [Jatrophihabitantaceae bacterium]|nr:hypothetical protein [Jatrophihabitantaceae bacterium]